jgi:hypothetical protein
MNGFYENHEIELQTLLISSRFTDKNNVDASLGRILWEYKPAE